MTHVGGSRLVPHVSTTHSRGRKLDAVSMTHERLTRDTDKCVKRDTDKPHDNDHNHTTLSTSEKVNDIIATADSWVTQSYLP
jgi:hypothetical protein